MQWIRIAEVSIAVAKAGVKLEWQLLPRRFRQGEVQQIVAQRLARQPHAPVA